MMISDWQLGRRLIRNPSHTLLALFPEFLQGKEYLLRELCCLLDLAFLPN